MAWNGGRPSIRGRDLTAVGAAVLLTAVGLGTWAIAGNLPAASAASTWSSTSLPLPSAAQGQVRMAGTACPAVGQCIAVGSYINPNNNSYEAPLIETLSGGTWTATTPPLPSGSEQGSLTAVSCPTTTSCVAVGTDYSTAGYPYGFAETLSDGTWTATGPFALPSDGQDAYVEGISCTSSTSCVAIGDYQQVSTYASLGLAYTLSGTSWTVTGDLNGTSRTVLTGVDCLTATSCIAVGYAGNTNQGPLVETLSGSTWTSTVLANPPAAVNGSELNGVWCASANSCVAVGYMDETNYSTSPPVLIDKPLTETLSGSGWTADADLPATDASVSLSGVDCTTATSCVAVGSTTDTTDEPSGDDSAVAYTLSDTTWSRTTGLNPPGVTSAALDAVACPVPSACVAVGSEESAFGAFAAVETPAPATQFVISAPSTATAGTSFDVTVTAEDASGDTATGYTGSKTLTFSGPANSPDGTAPTYPATVDFIDGVGTASITLTDAQSTTLTATQGALTGSSGSITVNPAAAASFDILAPSTMAAGSTGGVFVAALDDYGNVTNSDDGTHTLAFSGPASSPNGTAPTYPAMVDFSNGYAFTSITLTDAQTTTLTLTQGTVTGTSSSIDVTPGTLAGLSASAPPTATVGAPSNLRVTAIDADGNTATGYTGTVHFTSTDPQAGLPPNSTLTNDSGTFPITFKTPGTQRVTATDTGNSALNATTGPVAVTATAGAPRNLAVSNTAGDARLTWSPPATSGGTPVLRYEIFRGQAAGGESPVALASTTATSYDDTSVVAGVRYYYVVRAVNAVGTSPASNEASGLISSGLSGGARFAGTPDGKGYWVVSPTGAVTAKGAATNFGSVRGRLNQPIVGMASTADGRGYWLVAADGGIFSFGDAHYHGSTGAMHLNKPIVGMAATPDGDGYWLAAADGGIFTFGDARYFGSLGGRHLAGAALGVLATPRGAGYSLIEGNGAAVRFGS